MRRGTTGTLQINLSIPCADIKSLFVTVEQGNVSVEKDINKMKISNEGIEVYYTQEDTLSFSVGSAEIQIRGVTNSGNAFASDVKRINFLKILKDGVIE